MLLPDGQEGADWKAAAKFLEDTTLGELQRLTG